MKSLKFIRYMTLTNFLGGLLIVISSLNAVTTLSDIYFVRDNARLTLVSPAPRPFTKTDNFYAIDYIETHSLQGVVARSHPKDLINSLAGPHRRKISYIMSLVLWESYKYKFASPFLKYLYCNNPSEFSVLENAPIKFFVIHYINTQVDKYEIRCSL